MEIFKKVSLRPTQLRTVADRRFEDAQALLRYRRTNGAVYMGGFVIECMLKALLLERFRWLQNAVPKERSEEDQRLWSLCYRSHDLEEILTNLPDMTEQLRKESIGLYRSLKSVCAEWTVFARYSPHMAEADDAEKFLDGIKDLKSWLGRRIRMRF